MKIVGIVQARMGSSRLPGKILIPVLGVPVLEWCIERLRRCKRLDEVVIATTVHPRDEEVCYFAQSKGYFFSRGSEEDVLGRYYQVALERKADIVVRLTSDCPLIDPEITDHVIARHLDAKHNDMTSNVFTRTFPRGFDTEVLTHSCLERVNAITQEQIYREHVTNYIHDFPEQFRIENIENDANRSDLRLCVDTEHDLKLIRKIYEELYASSHCFGHREIYALFDRKPDLRNINACVQQAKIFKKKE